MIRLYTHPVSGHGHRVELMLSLLSLPYETTVVDLRAKEQKGDAYTQLNPWGQVPLLVDGDDVVHDSTAILVYLARKYAGSTPWLPSEPLEAAQVQQWLSRASGELVQGPAIARRAHILGGGDIDLPAAQATAAVLLARMEAHLQGRAWLACGHPTIADVAMYTYVRVADEGDIDLSPFSAVSAWLGRVEALPGFVAMPRAARTLAS